MSDYASACMRTHRNNIARYCELLETELSEVERKYIQARLWEALSELQVLSASTFPLSIAAPADVAHLPARGAGISV